MEVCFVAGDEDSDLAVLKVPTGELRAIGVLPFAAFGDSEQLVVGDPVYAIGAPRRLRGTLTNGIVSAIDRDVEVEGRTMTLLQTNAALNSGNSGGPLISERGQVVGINVAKYMSGKDSVEGLGFAIPSAYLERIVNDLLKWGEVQPEPRLGVQVITDERGLRVDAVDPDTAAEAAGVLAGDYITAAQGQRIENTQDLFRVRRTLYVGDTLTLTLRRQGETLEVTLELEEAVD
jgi:serine protease Do